MLMIEKPDPIQQRHPDPLEAPDCLLVCIPQPQLELYQKNEEMIRKGGLLFLLPKVIILNILQQLDFKNYANIFRVCKQWKQLRDPLFKQLYNQLCKRNREIYGDLYQDVPEILKDLPFLKLFQTKLKIRREYNNVALNIKYRCHESQYYYEGKFDFYMNGKGICYYKNGGKYEGKFSYNARDGFGKYYWKNGDFYEGEWKANKRNGQGTFKWKNGSEYTGEWKNNQREGKGKYIGKSKNVYEGEFKNSEKHGFGVDRFKNGDIYEGDFVNGRRSGKGKYVWKNGDVYVGDYLNKKRTGKGEMIYSSGDHYIGDFVDNLFDGHGMYTWKSGQVFEGRFVKGKMIKEKKNDAEAIQNSPPKEGEEDVNNHKKCQIF